VQTEKVADLTRQIADLDAARTIETPSTGNLRTAAAINAQATALAAAAKLRATDDERRQAKRTSLVDKLTVEAKVLADLKIEGGAVAARGDAAVTDRAPSAPSWWRCRGTGSMDRPADKKCISSFYGIQSPLSPSCGCRDRFMVSIR